MRRLIAMTLALRRCSIGALVALISAAVMVLAPWYCDRATAAETVRLGIATWPGFAVGFVGKEKRLFSGLDVQIAIIDDIAARHAAFRSGDIDMMISSVDGFVQEYAQGLRGKIFIVTDQSLGGDGIVVKPEIKSIADLRGKTIAFARATPSHYLLYKVLQKAGMAPQDVVQVPVDDPGNAGQAFLGGSVDAAVTWEPLLSEVVKSGRGTILVTSRDFPGTIVDVLVASSKFADKSSILGEFANGWLRSVAYVEAHLAESLGIMAKGLNMKTEEASGIMSGLRLADRSTNEFFLCGPDAAALPIAKVIDDAGTFWLEQQIISEKPSMANIVSAVVCAKSGR
jgi:NitT/TauT family transport system substrate-binding protein